MQESDSERHRSGRRGHPAAGAAGCRARQLGIALAGDRRARVAAPGRVSAQEDGRREADGASLRCDRGAGFGAVRRGRWSRCWCRAPSAGTGCARPTSGSTRIAEVRAWFDRVTQILFATRYSTHANYASQQHETFMSLGAFGTGALLIEGIDGKGIRYKSVHLSELFIAEDRHGRIDTVHRRFEYTARQAKQAWGDATAGAHRRLCRDGTRAQVRVHPLRQAARGRQAGPGGLARHALGFLLCERRGPRAAVGKRLPQIPLCDQPLCRRRRARSMAGRRQ